MKLSRLLFWLFIAVATGVAVGVAFAIRQRRQLAQMSDAELRAYLEEKLTGRVSEEQLTMIQDAVLAKVRGRSRMSAVTGTVSYLEPDPMPSDAIVIVAIEDTSQMDVPAEQVGTQVIDQPGMVPVVYAVRFDPAEIVENHSYSVRATITSGDQLLWTTDTHYPVITRGNPLTADLQLFAVQEPVAE